MTGSAAAALAAVLIPPSVGRVVWYVAGDDDLTKPDEMSNIMRSHTPNANEDTHQPFAGEVVYVWNDRLVNVVVTDHIGNRFVRTSVVLRQDGDPEPAKPFCEWMPYQIGQARKHVPPAASPSDPLDVRPIDSGESGDQ